MAFNFFSPNFLLWVSLFSCSLQGSCLSSSKPHNLDKKILSFSLWNLFVCLVNDNRVSDRRLDKWGYQVESGALGHPNSVSLLPSVWWNACEKITSSISSHFPSLRPSRHPLPLLGRCFDHLFLIIWLWLEIMILIIPNGKFCLMTWFPPFPILVKLCIGDSHVPSIWVCGRHPEKDKFAVKFPNLIHGMAFLLVVMVAFFLPIGGLHLRKTTKTRGFCVGIQWDSDSL